jgi:hypothetical protein
MNLVEVDDDTKKKVNKHTKGKPAGGYPWWYVIVLPEKAIEAVSNGKGIVKPGLTVYLIAGHDRTIYPDGAPVDGLKIHEYVGLVKGTAWQPLVQLGRDVDMV